MNQRLNALILISLFYFSLYPAITSRAQEPPTWEGQIVYIGPDGNLWLLRGDTPQPFQLTNDASEVRRYNSPLFSPRGDLLAYCQNDDSGQEASQLYLMRTSSWQPIQIADDLYCQHWPQGSFSWSPDGKQIAYARSFEYTPQADGSQWSQYHGIWTVDVGSGNTSELVPPPGKNPLILPSWSPDGNWLRMYESVYLEGLGVLRTWERQSGAVYNWLEMGADLYPGFSDWSPDGARLVFDEVTYMGYPDAGLFTAAPGGGDLKQIYNAANQAALHPLWSPDGRSLAFLLNEYGDSPENIIVVSAPDGSNVVPVYSSHGTLDVLDWSPDGRQLLFASTEVTDSGEQTGLFIYDLDSASHFTAALSGVKQADWAPAYVEDKSIHGGKPGEIPDFRAQGSPLAYLANNYQLMLYDPASGDQAELSPPLVAREYWASPSGTRLVYADQLVILKVGEDGRVTQTTVGLPASPSGEIVTWSPDETRLAFRDGLGSVWMVQVGSDFVEIPGASSLPTWSFDGRYLSYCTDGDRMWAVGGGISLRQVAAGVECQGDSAPQWSTSQPLLVYTQVVSGTQNSLVYVYNAERGESDPAMADVALIGWSPDGNLLGLRQADSAGAKTFTDYALEPKRGKSLEVGSIDLSKPGNPGWSESSKDYILGAYQFDRRLGKSERLAETLFDAAEQGRILLIGSETGGLQEVLCQNANADEPRSLLSANLSGIPADEKPGLWAWLAPDGVWSAAYMFDPSGYRYLLTRCDRTRQIALESSLSPENDAFSPDGNWFLQLPNAGGGASQLLVYNLDTLERQNLGMLPASKAVWVKTPQITVQTTSSVSGKVSAADGSPLAGAAILVDGEPAAASDETGAFTLADLVAGEHTISASLDGMQFSPTSISISVPTAEEEIVFTANAAAEGVAILTEPAPTAAGEEDQGTQVPTQGSEASTETDASAQPPGITSISANTLGMALGGLLIIVLLVILIWRMRSRRSDSALPAPVVIEPGPAEAGAAPQAEAQQEIPAAAAAASKSGPRAEADRLLREGVAQVKAGQNAAGLEKLRRVVQVYPQNAVAWLWSGIAATRLKDWRTAEQCFRRAKELNHPKAGEALEWLAEQRKLG